MSVRVAVYVLGTRCDNLPTVQPVAWESTFDTAEAAAWAAWSHSLEFPEQLHLLCIDGERVAVAKRGKILWSAS